MFTSRYRNRNRMSLRRIALCSAIVFTLLCTGAHVARAADDPSPVSEHTARQPMRYRVRTVILVYNGGKWLNVPPGYDDFRSITELFCCPLSQLATAEPDYQPAAVPYAANPEPGDAVELAVAIAANGSHLKFDRTRSTKLEFRRIAASTNGMGGLRVSRPVDGHLVNGQTADETHAQWNVLYPDDPMHYGYAFEVDLEHEIIVYNSEVNDRLASRIARPGNWDPIFQPWLESDRYIESNESSIEQLLQSLTNGRAADMRPYPLARLLLKGTIDRAKSPEPLVIRKVEPESEKRRRPIGDDPRQSVCGLNVKGADEFLKTGKGSPHDAVCLFVAMCRAANVPARPVIGFHVDKPDVLLSWAEFYLPELGWIPVDVRRFVENPGFVHDIDQHWKGFGTWDDLNRYIPLAYRFEPTGNFDSTCPWPLLWGTKPYINMPVVQWLRVESHNLGIKKDGSR